jgi:hypothetical protein
LDVAVHAQTLGAVTEIVWFPPVTFSLTGVTA